MEEVQVFELWLGFEHWEQQPEDDPTDDFFNMHVKLPDGRRYALNVWTFKVLNKLRYPWQYIEGEGEPAEYLLPPDLFVERLDRRLIEQVVARMLAKGEMKPEWLCPPNDDTD